MEINKYTCYSHREKRSIRVTKGNYFLNSIASLSSWGLWGRGRSVGSQVGVDAVTVSVLLYLLVLLGGSV